jgi:hypothetical protein
MATAPVAYPITFEVEPQLTNRNKTTAFFRIFLFIPHGLILGGLGEAGGLGGAAFAMAIVAWFAVIFWRTHPQGLWDFAGYFLRWSGRAYAYLALLRDEFPPLGDHDYPARVNVGQKPDDATRDRWSVGLRLVYVIPHAIVLAFLAVAAVVVVIVAWFAILFTGAYPEGLYGFVTGVVRWGTRIGGYVLLMHDQYPPFSLE